MENIGKLHYDDRKGLSITIKPSAITDADIDVIHEFIATRISGK